tara:strand:- start:49 stop:438 length:390 start_codon:yes stop_codon:yes gene_type:complete
MNIPKVSISWGELFDKITILQIKLENLRAKGALINVKKELDELNIIYNHSFSENDDAKQLITDLKFINEKLWDIEDRIRDKERSKSFDKSFIELARSVYFTNDERSRIKKKINNFFGSELIEEKSYADY